MWISVPSANKQTLGSKGVRCVPMKERLVQIVTVGSVKIHDQIIMGLAKVCARLEGSNPHQVLTEVMASATIKRNARRRKTDERQYAAYKRIFNKLGYYD